jgi:hypothetical protein
MVHTMSQDAPALDADRERVRAAYESLFTT